MEDKDQKSDSTSDLEKAEGFAETLKRLVGLIAIVFGAASAYDPTFWGLLWLNPVIAGEAFYYAVFASVVLALVVVIIDWKHLKVPPEKRPINLKLNLISLILSSVGLAALINVTVSYQASYPPASLDSAFWRRHLLRAEYVLFVTLTVFFITRVALKLYPQRKTNPVSKPISTNEDGKK